MMQNETEKLAIPAMTAEKSEAPIPREELESGNFPELRAKIVAVLKSVFDPEIPVDIYELGLIYNVIIEDGGRVKVRMTLTSPACPVAGTLPPEVEQKVKAVEGVSECVVELVWDPPWDRERMSEVARLQLNFY